MRIAVIGLGGAGAHAARILAQEGHAVTGFEQFTEGHARGSSHGASRIIRHAYENPVYTKLMRQAYPMWERFEEEAGESLFVRCGGLTLGPATHPRILRTRDSMLSQGIAFDEAPAAEAQARWPALAFQEGEIALFQPDAGFLRADACVAASWRLARAAGANLLEGRGVSDLRWQDGRVVMATPSGEADFDACIVSAGAWAAKLLPHLQGRLTVLKQQVVHLELEAGADAGMHRPERMPVWIDGGSHDYGFPADGVSPGVKVAHHLDGNEVDPDADSRDVDLERERGMIERVRRRVPGLSARVLHAAACLYTMAPGEDFVIERVPGAPGIIVASACSGHGFKFTVLTGRLAADLATSR